MKYSIVFSSNTGNTAMMAMKIKEELGNQDCTYFGSMDIGVPEDKVIFVGFWTDKGTCDETVQRFLSKVEDKDIFLFGTAGFNDDPAYFNEIICRVKNFVSPSNRIIGTFMCMGKMPISLRNKYVKRLKDNPVDAQTKRMLENFDKALLHPNQEDVEALIATLQKTWNNVRVAKINHISMYVENLEKMKMFYSTYFGGKSSELQQNKDTGMQSYFLTFLNGCRLELMAKSGIPVNKKKVEKTGYVHMAFSVGNKKDVEWTTMRLEAHGYEVLSGPITTKDGYYESCVLDPEGNRVEIIE